MNTTETTMFSPIGAGQIALLVIGVLIFVSVPIAISLIWKKKRKEPISTIIIGAVTFLLFALILEKPIQNVIAFPTTMGLPDHAVSLFLNAHPVLLALVIGLFPGVFEETGRLVAFKTVLKKRQNRETSISYGIGHGGFEVVLMFGITYVQYITYCIMINTGAFQNVVEQLAAQSPNQLGAVTELVAALSAFSFADLGAALFERVFAVLFHIGASILVFYASKDKKKLWLYPLAILLHTALDFIGPLKIFVVADISLWALEGIVAVFGLSVFFGAYNLLYKKDELDSGKIWKNSTQRKERYGKIGSV